MTPPTGFTITCEMLPWLGAPGGAKSAPPTQQNSTRPTVTVFPYLSEQRSSGVKSTRGASSSGETLAKRIRDAFAKAVPNVDLKLLSEDDAANAASDLQLFLTFAWTHLRDTNFLVTHRNFLANEILSRAGLSNKSFVPNAAVIRLRVTEQASTKTKELYMIRHCASHHNVARLGNAGMTTCANVEGLRRIAPHLAALAGATDPAKVLYGCSILPRAILSAIALQMPLTAEQLERTRRAFQQPAADPEAVATYVRDNVCGGPGEKKYPDSDYCAARDRGKETRSVRTFKLYSGA